MMESREEIKAIAELRRSVAAKAASVASQLALTRGKLKSIDWEKDNEDVKEDSILVCKSAVLQYRRNALDAMIIVCGEQTEDALQNLFAEEIKTSSDDFVHSACVFADELSEFNERIEAVLNQCKKGMVYWSPETDVWEICYDVLMCFIGAFDEVKRVVTELQENLHSINKA